MQVLSDGPNVNLAFLKRYSSIQEEKELEPPMDLGTCGLHEAHSIVKAGAKASEWELQKLLKDMWQFIHDAHARRAMYKNISESTNYSAKFCGHRWCENKKCAEKAESLIKGYQKFVTHVFIVKKNWQRDGKNKTFIVLKKMIHDLLIPAKLKFFKMVSHKLNAFLRGFQTDSPMVLSSLMFLVGLCVICWKELSSRMCYVRLLIYTNLFLSIHLMDHKEVCC